MVDIAQLTLLTVIVAMLSNVDGGFDRRALGLCVVALAGIVVADSVLRVPQTTLQAVSVLGVALVFATFVAVLFTRHRRRGDRPA